MSVRQGGGFSRRREPENPEFKTCYDYYVLARGWGGYCTFCRNYAPTHTPTIDEHCSCGLLCYFFLCPHADDDSLTICYNGGICKVNSNKSFEHILARYDSSCRIKSNPSLLVFLGERGRKVKKGGERYLSGTVFTVEHVSQIHGRINLDSLCNGLYRLGWACNSGNKRGGTSLYQQYFELPSCAALLRTCLSFSALNLFP